jgi:chemotaxis protein methyltransferase CheR
MHPNSAEWNEFYDKMLKRTRLNLHDYKANQLQRRIVGMMEVKGCKNLEDFWTKISTEPDGIVWFQDKLAINVSELWRNPEKWNQLENQVLPDLLSRTRTLKVWSAGCSYGAEAYSLAAILDKKFKGAHQVIGTDIDQAALDQARRGEFSDPDMRGVPAEFRQYFKKVGSAWFADSAVKKYLKFKSKNLLEDNRDSGYDLIICRNVVIYFTEEAKNKLYERFFNALKPGGILFVGSTERIGNAGKIGFEQNIPFFYQRPNAGNKEWRNAS